MKVSDDIICIINRGLYNAPKIKKKVSYKKYEGRKMSYKNDSNLVILNKFSNASSDAKAQLFETYDRLRDLTVSGSASSGTGFEAAGGFLYQLASLFAPSAFMTTMGGTTAMNIPGTSYWSKYTGGTGGLTGTYSSFGVNSLGNYSGFPSGHAAPLSGYATGGAAGLSTMFGYGSSPSGMPTGFASGIGSIADIANMVNRDYTSQEDDSDDDILGIDV